MNAGKAIGADAGGIVAVRGIGRAVAQVDGNGIAGFAVTNADRDTGCHGYGVVAATALLQTLPLIRLPPHRLMPRRLLNEQVLSLTR